VKQCNSGIFNSQAKYAVKIFEKFSMKDCQLVDTRVECGIKLTKEGETAQVNPRYYKSIVGFLRYLTCIMLDILFEYGLVIRYTKHPRNSHLKTSKKILCFVKGSSSLV